MNSTTKKYSLSRSHPHNRLSRLVLPLATIALLLASGITQAVAGMQNIPGNLAGTVSTIGPNGQTVPLPGATVKLSGVSSGTSAHSLFSDEKGEFRFSELPSGNYDLEVTLSGFKKISTKVVIQSNQTETKNLVLEIEEVSGEITIHDETKAIDLTQASPSEGFKQDSLQTVPLLNEKFEEALPLVPGVVRGPNGQINLKGARPNESGFVINGATATDPATGEYAVNLPLEAIGSLQVLTNPYSAEYSRFTGAITSIETRTGSEKWKVQFYNFFPRIRRRNGNFVGIGSVTPRMALSGPLITNRLKVFQSLEYRFVRTQVEVDTLPPLKRDKEIENFNSFTQFDWDINARNHLTSSFSLFPQKFRFFNLDTFNPEPSTANIKERGFLWAISEKSTLSAEALLESNFSIRQLDANIFPSSGTGVMNFAPDVNSGSFFNRQDRSTVRYEGLEVLSFTPPRFAGAHLMKVGAGFSYDNFDGRNRSNSVRVLRADGTRSQQIDFVGNTFLDRDKAEFLAYFQDKWILNERLTFEYGLRYDADTISDENNFAPRVAFAFLPIKDGKTIVRGGVGLFYDKVNFNVATFRQLQERIITRFAADGATILGAPRLQRFILDEGHFQTPRSVNWNIELDREWIKNLYIRLGYQERDGRREYTLNPLEDPARGSSLALGNGGNSRYREFQVTARYLFRKSDQVVASYVRSRATGNVNDFNSLFGNVENPIIRPDERTLLPWDTPNRLLVWGDINLKYKITVSPVLDIHTGFPKSIIDEDRNFVGRRNRAGRFPTFASFDLQILKGVNIPLRGRKYKAKVGLKIFNLTNHFNPRDFQGNLASSNFGVFTNSVDRKYGGKFVLEF